MWCLYSLKKELSMCKQIILYILFWKKGKYENCEELLSKYNFDNIILAFLF